MDIDKKRLLHCLKRIVEVEKLFNDEVDELLEIVGVTRKEVRNGELCKEANT